MAQTLNFKATRSAAAMIIALTSIAVAESQHDSPEVVNHTGGDVSAIENDAGVFVLPLNGQIGLEIRSNEIEALGAHVDTFGPEQTIVLQIHCNGGAQTPSLEVADSILRLSRNHRVVGWVDSACHNGAMIAFACDDIYFRSWGTLGFVGSNSRGEDGPSLEQLAPFDAVVAAQGRSPLLVHAMKNRNYLLSYDRDAATGSVVFHDNGTGRFQLNGLGEKLCLDSQSALQCGVSNGTADTEEELTQLLGMAEWHEKSDFGRTIVRQWKAVLDEAQKHVPEIIAEIDRVTRFSDPKERLTERIHLHESLLPWCYAAGTYTESEYGLEAAKVERQLQQDRAALQSLLKGEENQLLLEDEARCHVSRLLVRLGYYSCLHGDPEEMFQRRLDILEQLLDWCTQMPEIANEFRLDLTQLEERAAEDYRAVEYIRRTMYESTTDYGDASVNP